MSHRLLNTIKKCKYGTMIYNVNDIYVGQALQHYGEYSEGEIRVFDQYVKEGDTVLDIGANLGTHTIYFSKKVGNTQGLVIAIEPQRIVFQTLCANVAVNSLINVLTYNVCFDKKPGVIKVPMLDPYSPNNFGALELGHEYEKGEYIDVMTVDMLELSSCDFMKIDVEGMETNVILGATNTIKRTHPILYVESDRLELSRELIGTIRKFNYDIYWHTPPLYNPDNFLKNKENRYPYDRTINLLCLPKSKNLQRPLRLVEVNEENIESAPEGSY